MGALSGETWMGSQTGCEDGSGITPQESHNMDIRLETHSLLVDDDLPFDLFGGEIRAFIKLFVPGDYGRIDEQYLIRFQSGAALLLTPQEARQVEESLHHNTGVDAFGYKQGTPSPAWP